MCATPLAVRLICTTPEGGDGRASVDWPRLVVHATSAARVANNSAPNLVWCSTFLFIRDCLLIVPRFVCARSHQRIRGVRDCNYYVHLACTRRCLVPEMWDEMDVAATMAHREILQQAAASGQNRSLTLV